jgi:hypothetical protein
MVETVTQPVAQEIAGHHQQADGEPRDQREPPGGVQIFQYDSLKVGGSRSPTSCVISSIHLPQPCFSSRCDILFEVVLCMDSDTTEREAEHQHTQSASGFHGSCLHGDVLPPHSSHRTRSPTTISPLSRTSANASPAQSVYIAFCMSGQASSIRSQGLVSPRMRMRHAPMQSICSYAHLALLVQAGVHHLRAVQRMPRAIVPRRRGVGRTPTPLATRSGRSRHYGQFGPGHKGHVALSTSTTVGQRQNELVHDAITKTWSLKLYGPQFGGTLGK